jgi:ubiquinol-cytochrome c reductase cytochrome b subunit
MKQLFWIFVADCILLGYVGAQTADAAWHVGEAELPLVWLARLGTLYYFGFFWVLMPWIGKKEVTRPLPESIAQSVLAKGGH